MRKIVLIVLIILLLVGAGFTIANGFQIGKFQIWGVKGIISKNDTIDNKNEELSSLVSVTYPSTLAELDTSSETLASTKKEYEDKAILVSNSKYYMQTEKYDIEFLWTKLGFYAKDNNVQIKIDVVNSTTSGLYDLNFTIAGKYSDVTDFIYDVENDSKLGFKIEDFHMSANGDGVQGAFSCKEISINIEEAGTDAENPEGMEEMQDEQQLDNSANQDATSITPEQSGSSNTTNTTIEENTTNTATQGNTTATNEVTDSQSTADV